MAAAAFLVGLCGAARCGKSSAAAALAEQHAAAGCREVTFAGPIREFTRGLLGVDAAAFEAIKDAPHPLFAGKTPRFAMQTLGTEWGRDTVSGTLWIDACMREVGALRGAGVPVVVSDVRFEDEARAIREAGGTVVRIHRPSLPSIAPGDRCHVSERGIPDHLVDVVWTNDHACVADFKRAVAAAL